MDIFRICFGPYVQKILNKVFNTLLFVSSNFCFMIFRYLEQYKAVLIKWIKFFNGWQTDSLKYLDNKLDSQKNLDLASEINSDMAIV